MAAGKKSKAAAVEVKGVKAVESPEAKGVKTAKAPEVAAKPAARKANAPQAAQQGKKGKKGTEQGKKMKNGHAENMKKMKLTAHKNAAEVHRRMSPMHDMNKAPHPIVRNRESLVPQSDTPTFSDAEKTYCSQLWNQILRYYSDITTAYIQK